MRRSLMRHARLAEEHAARKPAADSADRPVSHATPQPSRRALAIQATLRTLQRKCACGGSCSACKKGAEHGDSEHRHETAQHVPSLKINQPGDRFEREADAVAEQVMRTTQRRSGNALSSNSSPGLQRKCAHCEEEEKRQKVQRAETGAGPDVAPPIVHEVLG